MIVDRVRRCRQCRAGLDRSAGTEGVNVEGSQVRTYRIGRDTAVEELAAIFPTRASDVNPATCFDQSASGKVLWETVAGAV